MNGLPDLRLLPDAPVPDGRTVLTTLDTIGRRGGHGSRAASRPFILDTNTIEAMHRQICKAIKTGGHFPDEQAATKLIYLALERAETKWRSARNWTPALAALKIHFGDRLPD